MEKVEMSDLFQEILLLSKRQLEITNNLFVNDLQYNSNSLPTSTFLCKVMDELGELAQEVKKLTLMKNPENYSIFPKNKITENIKSKLAYTVQSLFALAAILEIDYESLVEEIQLKNHKWDDSLRNHFHN